MDAPSIHGTKLRGRFGRASLAGIGGFSEVWSGGRPDRTRMPQPKPGAEVDVCGRERLGDKRQSAEHKHQTRDAEPKSDVSAIGVTASGKERPVLGTSVQSGTHRRPPTTVGISSARTEPFRLGPVRIPGAPPRSDFRVPALEHRMAQLARWRPAPVLHVGDDMPAGVESFPQLA
jgi:hypothetical protein